MIFIFWTGFGLMVLNEGFVIMRHQSPLFAKWRDKLIENFGDSWKKFLSALDWVWTNAVVWGWIFTPWNQKFVGLAAFITFWFCVLLFVYVPIWLKDENESTN